jgi:hypothetical protein
MGFELQEKFYTTDEFEEFFLACEISKIHTVWDRRNVYYFNASCSFDIETTSFYVENGTTYSSDNEEKTRDKEAVMYVWQFGINGRCVIGRTWKQFIEFIDKLSDKLGLNERRRIIVYVHNLSYEFQFMRKWFTWDSVFATDSRNPIKAVTSIGVEFRDSYILSGYSLAKLGDELQKYHVKKLVGALDYSKLRHYKTPLTDTEISYCLGDIRVVMAFIQEKIETDGDITKIPLTKTGYVRNFCRNWCYYGNMPRKKNKFYKPYKNLMKSLTITKDEYLQAKRCFQGGFTHGNSQYIGKLLHDVASFDFTSSYPTVMLCEFFPMSKATKETITSKEQFRKLLKEKCCMFDVEFTNIRPRVFFENPLSRSKCFVCENPIENNGRIVYADKVATTITNVDFDILEKFYEWDSMKVANFRSYMKSYLPTNFVKSILELYANKTTLKGVQGKEVEYLLSKGMLNACYGMTVTDIVKDEQIYIDEWTITPANVDEQIEKYNKGKSRFLFYLWGIFVTAYARKNLFSGIYSCGTDYVYSDTDSIKVLNYQNHMDYIEKYNNNIVKKLEVAMKFHHLPIESISPKTIKGVKKTIGVWDFEGVYKSFKTLGAKRYMTLEENNAISFTVSGINKKFGVPYLLKETNTKYETDKHGNYIIEGSEENAFNMFDVGLVVPVGYTGKNTHTYIDDEYEGYLTDYLGNTEKVKELSSVHMCGASYEMSISTQFEKFLKGVRTNAVL